MSIQINIERHEEITKVAFKGRLDGNTMKEVEEQLQTMVFEPKEGKVIFNLDELEYISSAGLRVMLLALKRLAAYKGTLVLYGLHPNVQHIFDLSGFSTIFTIVTTYEDGLARFK